MHRTVQFTYVADVREVPSDANSVVMWIPVPQTTAHQVIEGIRVESSWEYEIVHEPKYGNKYVRLERPESFSFSGADGPAAILSFRVERAVRRSLDEGDASESYSAEDLNEFLKPSRLIRIEGPVAEEARRIAGGVTGSLGQAKSLYDNIVDTVVYDKSGDGWGRGDSVYACDTREGNCTDFHSLFIGETRYLGIPSRFLMGFSVPRGRAEGEIDGYHCWAEFYEGGVGWVPIDASEAFKDPSRREFLFGGLDADRVQFTVGRDIVLPKMRGEPVNYSIYPYVEVDGKVHDDVMKKFSFREVELAVR